MSSLPPTRIAMLADLAEPVTPDAISEPAAFAFELADALREVSGDLGSFEVDLFARRGSWRGLPLVSLDPAELAPSGDPLADFSAQEALYTHAIAAGLLGGYDLVHCLAPVVTPLQLLAASDIPVVHTVLAPPDHPAASFPGLLLPPRLLRRTRVALRPGREWSGTEAVIPTVDVTRFRPTGAAQESFALWLGAGGEAGRSAASRVASRLGVALRTADDGDPADLLSRSRILLHLVNPGEAPEWTGPLRALACGQPVAAWAGCGLEELLLGEPWAGVLAPAGDEAELVQAITTLETADADRALRRQLVLARYSRRPVVGRYRDLYAEVIRASWNSPPTLSEEHPFEAPL